MKKFNINCIVAVFAAIFILTGISRSYLGGLKTGLVDMFLSVKSLDMAGLVDAEASIESASERLRTHGIMMDVDSIRNNLLGTRVVFKDDITVIKANSGSLIRKSSGFETETSVERIQQIKTIAEDNGAAFLYCNVPKKNLYETGPSNVGDYYQESHNLFISEIDKARIPVLDFSKMFEENNVSGRDVYFYTDHHWKPIYGFMAATAICEELSKRYGFAYDEYYTDIRHYNIQNYANWFLGSYGKKVGRYFTWHGADDFELITPNFETSLIEERPLENKRREGTFEETVLFLSHLEKNYYHKNTYWTYSDGNHGLQIVKNNLNLNGKKILIVRDSFACVVTPFLSLQTKELHVCDIRDNVIKEERINIDRYIREQKPDYVILIFGEGNIGGDNIVITSQKNTTKSILMDNKRLGKCRRSSYYEF